MLQVMIFTRLVNETSRKAAHTFNFVLCSNTSYTAWLLQVNCCQLMASRYQYFQHDTAYYVTRLHTLALGKSK